MDSFAGRLRQAMEIRNMSAAELARRSGIGRNSISDYLKGKYEAKQDKLSRLATALGANEAWLMGYPKVAFERSSIDSIYNQLQFDRQRNVINYAQQQLDEQNAPASSVHEYEEPELLAAHLENRNLNDEQQERVDDYIAKLLQEEKKE